MAEDFDILGSEGLFFFCTLLRILKQGVSSSICFAMKIIDLEVVIKEFLDLADLSWAQTLCVHEPAKVVMVGKYKNLLLRTLQVVSSSLESLNNG